MKTPDQLTRAYLGIPYVHLGRSATGLDCWGLIVHIYKQELGVDLFDLDHYDRDWAKQGEDHFLQNNHGKWRTVDVGKARYLDVILFKNHNGVPYHSGLYLSNGYFLQSAGNVGVVKTKLDPTWLSKLYNVNRYLGGANG